MMAIEVLSPSTNRLLAIGASVPIGETGLVHIWGRNDSLRTQALGIVWTVKDPDGAVVEEYADWSYGHGPGDDHEFIGDRFDLAKEGTYTLEVDLVMGTFDNPVVVDSYEGALCTVTLEIPPEYELIQDTVYPYAYVYDGEAELSIFTFTTASFIPADWAAEKFAAAVESEVEKAGGRIIELKVYADKTPLLWTDFRIEVIGTPLVETVEAAPGVGIAVGIPIWAIILIVALGIALLIAVITWSIQTIVKTFTHKPLSEEIKKTWSKETLIGCINDFEVELERTPTPPAELEEKSEEELRVYCDSLAEEIVPPGVSWWPLAILGGVAVVGIGAAAAFALAGRK